MCIQLYKSETSDLNKLLVRVDLCLIARTESLLVFCLIFFLIPSKKELLENADLSMLYFNLLNDQLSFLYISYLTIYVLIHNHTDPWFSTKNFLLNRNHHEAENVVALTTTQKKKPYKVEIYEIPFDGCDKVYRFEWK